MPAALVKKYAQEFGVPVETIERLWRKAKEVALLYRPADDPEYYAIVVGVLKKLVRKYQKESLARRILETEDVWTEITAVNGIKNLGPPISYIFYCPKCDSVSKKATESESCSGCGSSDVEKIGIGDFKKGPAVLPIIIPKDD